MRIKVKPIMIIYILSLGIIMAPSNVSSENIDKTLEKVIVDFNEETLAWNNIDDVVMGGISSSQMEISKDKATFRGVLSLENNGGFASIRSAENSKSLDGFDGLILRVKGDGNAYQFRLRDSSEYNSHNYSLRFTTTKGQWTIVKLPFDQFTAGYRGRILRSYPPIKGKDIRTFGLLISDKQEGSFTLDIDWIKAYKNEE
jgi:monofunctional biosynthetic peptidoglycan transglycosylase